jgi:hypothetical protein
MKCIFEKGSRGIVPYEEDYYPAGRVGISAPESVPWATTNEAMAAGLTT